MNEPDWIVFTALIFPTAFWLYILWKCAKGTKW